MFRTPRRQSTRLSSIPALVVLVLSVAITACQQRSEPETGHDGHADHAPAALGSLPPCGDGPVPDLALKARKDRIAKGVYRASRRIDVDGDLELWETPYGRYWVVAGNFNTMSEVLGEQAIEIYGDAERGVRKGDVVLDGGAHFGAFTRKALDRGASLVVAIEIAPENIACIRRNFAEEIARGRVIVYEKGVWDKDDTMVLERKNHTWADRVAEAGPGPTVSVTTIDRIVSELKLPRVDFIKLDIEGAERNALAGAAATMERHRPRMAVASYHREDDLEVLPGLALRAQPAYTTCVGGAGLGHGYTTLFFK
ncbi:MAG TPA: FkbM family methyltransferase [Vicinamibacterales bacterium]